MNRYRIAAAILATTALCSPALAAWVETDSDTGTIAVSLTVVDDCVLETEPLAFPDNGIVDEDVTASTTITIECTRDSAYAIGLSAGANAGGTDIDNRKLKLTTGDNTDVLSYQLYSDSNFSNEWGHTIGTNTVDSASADGEAEEYTIYGLIPDHQNAPAGAYADLITATIWYGDDLP
jgi:spore coat protein U-like protein